LHFDLIICNKAFDDTTCIAHFIDELIFYSWVYSLIDHKKKTLLSVFKFKDLINQCDWIRFNERAIIRIIRIDQEIFIDKKLEDWMRAQEINWDWSTKNISEQNKKFERFDELLIEKTKCIKEHAKLSKDFYSECYLVVAHILNRTSSSSLSWDSSLIFMSKLLKKSIRNEIVHLKMFDCKAFLLLEETDALKKNEKMKSRTFIKYLIKYDFINIFRVWNSKKKRRKWLSRRHIQWDEVFQHVRSNRSFQERKKKILCNVSCDLAADICKQRWKVIQQDIITKACTR
jgi:hypothetical protein